MQAPSPLPVVDADILVAGTGPAGLICALSMAQAGFKVRLVGPRPRTDDRRTTALMVPALRYLSTLGVGEELASEAAPLEAMRIVDGTARLIRSPTVTFRAGEIGEAHFGLNIPNAHLNATLRAAVERQPEITWHHGLVERWETLPQAVAVRLEDGTRLAARLAAAADGRDSPARQAAGIQARAHRFGQSALVVSFAHTRPHGSVSTEFHTETGPFTQVPLRGLRSSLVWVVTPKEAEELAGLPDNALSRRIEDRMQSMLGRVSVEAGRQVYPLTSALPSHFARSRIALVGEAAHLFPPIGAQGLNLGIRDVRDLVSTAVEHVSDPGSDAALDAYDRRRRPDILARAGAVDLLNRSLLSDLLPAQFLRSAGLSALRTLPPLRSFFMREGLQPGSGFRGLFGDLREQVRR
ncbi:MAG: UbiH/UbiF family hydroxylase [Rhizobiaceae bacterium]|nr:UbiH/UbiF family hydroxylase [Rhizobiaceae bacterium]